MSEKKKISVDQLMTDIRFITNQIKGLELLLAGKKSTCKEYFKRTGKKSISNDELTIFTQERTKIDYDMEAIQENVDSNLVKLFVDKSIDVINSKELMKLLKKYEIPKHEYRKCLVMSRTVNEKKLNKLYESGQVTVDDLNGCYTASTSVSVAIKLKNADTTINVG